MVLLVAVLVGSIAGLAYAKITRRIWRPPNFLAVWLAFFGFFPQLLSIYIPFTRQYFSDQLASFSLVLSQLLLFLFAVINRRLPGMYLFLFGFGCNLLVILLNGGFMPLSINTAAKLWPESVLSTLNIGGRIHAASKDILLQGEQIVLPWLADRFVSPDFIMPIRFAYSFGDVLISFGTFYLLIKSTVPFALPHQERTL